MREVKGAARLLAAEGVPDSAKRAFLIALAEKGETPDEVAGLAEVFRDLARDPGLGQVAHGALDVAGTGGDRSEALIFRQWLHLSPAQGCSRAEARESRHHFAEREFRLSRFLRNRDTS